MTGNLIMDANGDREPDYTISDMDKDGFFVKIAQVFHTGIGKKVGGKNMEPCARVFTCIYPSNGPLCSKQETSRG